MTNQERNALTDEARKAEFQDRAREYGALERELGPRVPEIILGTRARQTEAEWREIARDHGRNDIQGLLETLWTWVGEAGFEFTVERTDRAAQVRVTRCPLADMARSLGEETWGFRCYCQDDPSIVRGFNPRMAFRRTKTLMEGHDCCDHFYEEEPAAGS